MIRHLCCSFSVLLLGIAFTMKELKASDSNMGKSARKMAKKEYGTRIEILHGYFIAILRTRVVFYLFTTNHCGVYF